MGVFELIIIVHFFADFIMQAEYWALNKSKSLKALVSHTSVYSLVWIIPVYLMTNDITGTIFFVLVTFLAHTITDFFTSKVVSKMFAKKKLGSKIPNLGAFTIIGLDQVLHYLQLKYTWQIIFGL